MTELTLTNPGTTRSPSPRRAGPARPASLAIPDKLRFRIGEVARICGVQTSVLRFWETEFPQLRPGKGGTGQRLFRRHDVETALRIRHLLYIDGYTIPGARQLLRGIAPISAPAPHPYPAPHPPNQLSLSIDPPPPAMQLQALRQELRTLHALLSRTPISPRRRSPLPHAPSSSLRSLTPSKYTEITHRHALKSLPKPTSPRQLS